MEIPMKVTKNVNAKTMSIFLKVSDGFGAVVRDEEGNTIGGQDDGYVPGFMPGGGGDYVNLEIDLDTGQVTNWKPPKPEQIVAFLNGDDED